MPLLLSVAETLAGSLEPLLEPWQAAYADSAALSTGLTAAHLVGLLLGGGLAVAADRTTLRAAAGHPEARRRQLDELRAVHRPVLAALALLLATGVLIAAADVATYLASPVFWAKLGLVALLLANGLAMRRAEGTLRRAEAAGQPAAPHVWRLLRASAVVSLLLWTAITVMGVVLVNAG